MSTRPVHLQGRPTAPTPRSTQTPPTPSSPRPSAAFDWEATELAQELNEVSRRPAWRRLTGRATQAPSVSRELLAVGFATATVVQRRQLARNIFWPALRREFVDAQPGQPFFVRVQKTTLSDWRALVASIRQSGYECTVERFDGQGNQPVHRLRHRLAVHLNDQVQLVCRSAKENCIELTFDPQKITSEADFRLLSSFVERLSQALGRAIDIADDERVLFRTSVDGDHQLEVCPKGA